GAAITCVQVAGLVARRILCYVATGERLTRGQRFGFIRFGSRVDLYLPLDAQPLVTIGEKVAATETVLARLAPASAPAAEAASAVGEMPGAGEVSGAGEVPAEAAPGSRDDG